MASHTDTMDTMYADIEDGKRHDIAVEFINDRADAATGVDDWLRPDQRGQHERESVLLVVPDRYTERLNRLRSYFADEMEAVDDETIEQEVELLETLCQQAPATPHEVND